MTDPGDLEGPRGGGGVGALGSWPLFIENHAMSVFQ